MGHLSEEAKKELLAAAQSVSLSAEMAKTQTKESISRPYESETLEAFIRFASSLNRMAGHPRKKFEPIEGEHFLL